MENTKQKNIAEMKEALNELNMSTDGRTLIQDNKLFFPYKDINYRCRMPNQRELTEAEEIQNKHKVNLIQQDGTITKKQLIKLLKEKQDVDIPELEKQKLKLQEDLQNVYLEGAIITSDEPVKINKYKEKKKLIEEKFLDITIEISEFLTPSIEEQSKIQYFKYLAYLCTEKQIEDKDEFEPVWENFEAYQKNNDGLSIKTVESIHTLILSI